MSHRSLFALAALLVIPLALTACGGSSRSSADNAVPAASVAGPPPVAEEDAKRFVEKFVSAMNVKDNLALVRMIDSGGAFLVKTSGGDQLLNSQAFLRWFQGALHDARGYSAEIRSMTYEAKPGGAIVVAELNEEVSNRNQTTKSRTKIRFTLQDIDESLRCVRMDGAQ